MKICFNNNKGGTLKTTATTNLAGVLASESKSVLIVDADNQSNVALSFGVNPDTVKIGLKEVLTGESLPSEAIVKVHDYIDILPATDSMVGFEFDVIGNPDKYPNPFMMMKEQLQELEQFYDYILIDTPPSLSLIAGNAFAYSDYVLIPYVPEKYSMRSLAKVVKTVNEFKEEYNDNLQVLGILKTMVNSRTNLHRDIALATDSFALINSIKVFNTEIPRSIQFADSVAYNNLPATLLMKRDKADLYFELWEEMKLIIEGKVAK